MTYLNKKEDWFLFKLQSGDISTPVKTLKTSRLLPTKMKVHPFPSLSVNKCFTLFSSINLCPKYIFQTFHNDLAQKTIMYGKF